MKGGESLTVIWQHTWKTNVPVARLVRKRHHAADDLAHRGATNLQKNPHGSRLSLVRALHERLFGLKEQTAKQAGELELLVGEPPDR
jgi:hypothetical protein